MNRASYCIAVGLFVSSSLVLAEEIKIPVGSQSTELQTIAKPTIGMTQTQVKAKFGQPISEKEPKGKPPISSWEYTDYVVYFEYDHVIHTVLKAPQHPVKEVIIQTTEDEMSEDDLKPR